MDFAQYNGDMQTDNGWRKTIVGMTGVSVCQKTRRNGRRLMGDPEVVPMLGISCLRMGSRWAYQNHRNAWRLMGGKDTCGSGDNTEGVGL